MKKAMKLVSLVLAVVMLLGCLTACGSKSATTDATASTDTASNDTAAASDGGEIVIALISNTTGDYAEYGTPVRNAVMLYFDQLNAKGGINGKKVKLESMDDKGDATEASNAFNKLAGDNSVLGVVGPTRMDYAQITARLSYFAENLGRMFQKSQTPALEDPKKNNTPEG